MREEAATEANRFSAVNRDPERWLRNEKKITDGVLSARQIVTVAAVAEQGTETAAAVKAAEAAASVRMATAVEAAVQTTETAGAVEMAAVVETAIKTLKSRIKTSQSQLKEL